MTGTPSVQPLTPAIGAEILDIDLAEAGRTADLCRTPTTPPCC